MMSGFGLGIVHSAAGVSGSFGWIALLMALLAVKVAWKRKRPEAAPTGASNLPPGDKVASLVH